MRKRPSQSIRQAAYVNIATKYTAALIQLAYNVVLARILTPDDFGVVAIAQVFVVFFSIFTNMGIGSAVIQRQDLSCDDIRGLFGFTCLLGLALAGIFALCGAPMATFFERAELSGIALGLSVTILLATLNVVPNALLLKEKRFLAAGLRGIIAALAASTLSIACALHGIGAFAIVVYSIVSTLIVFAWNAAGCGLAPRLRGSLSAIRKVFSYSAYLFGFDFINYLCRNLDNLLVGKFLGSAALGNYAKAYQLMRLPQNYLTSAITPVLHPMLAEHQNNTEYLYRVFVKTVKILSLSGVFISIAGFFCADEIVAILYGRQWSEAGTCFKFLSISVWSQIVCATSGTMFQVLNRTREQFVRGVLIAFVVIAGAIIGVHIGTIEAVALCVSLAYYSAFATLLPFLIGIGFKRRFSEFLKALIPDVLIALILILVFGALSLIQFSHIAFALIVKLGVGTIVFAGLLVVFKQLKWFMPAMPASLAEKLGRFAK